VYINSVRTAEETLPAAVGCFVFYVIRGVSEESRLVVLIGISCNITKAIPAEIGTEIFHTCRF
jgi:hypothetical protein